MDAGGAHLDGIYFCPHHPTAGEPPYRQECDCRKPRPGLLHRAADQLGIDLARSYMIGDRLGDLELAWSVGATGVLVRTGYGRGELEYHAPPMAARAGHRGGPPAGSGGDDPGRRCGGACVKARAKPRSPEVTAEGLEAVIAAFKGRRILVLADLVADEFLYGSVQRVSREAPVLILEYDGTDVRLGGGANAVHNIQTLGGTPVPMGVVGGDEHGRRLRALLRERGIAARGVAVDPEYVTPVKTRILGGGTHSTKQQMVRIDKRTRLAGFERGARRRCWPPCADTRGRCTACW